MPKGHYERKGQYPAKTFKDTFWSKKRIDNNMLIKELAKMFGVSRSAMGAYFTGYLVPPENLCNTLCDYFGVDPIEGQREFLKAHKEYEAEHGEHRVLKASARKSKVKADKKPTTQVKPVVEPVKEEQRGMSDEEKLDAIARLLYKRVSYDEFRTLSHTHIDKLAEMSYGIVDYATHKTIENILDGNVVSVATFENGIEDKFRI